MKNKSTINLYDERRNPLGLGLRIYRSLIGLSMIIQGFKFASRYKKTKEFRQRRNNFSVIPATNIQKKIMTNESSQEAIKEIYKDNFYSLPVNRHKRDELIKKILFEQNELDIKKTPPK